MRVSSSLFTLESSAMRGATAFRSPVRPRPRMAAFFAAAAFTWRLALAPSRASARSFTAEAPPMLPMARPAFTMRLASSEVSRMEAHAARASFAFISPRRERAVTLAARASGPCSRARRSATAASPSARTSSKMAPYCSWVAAGSFSFATAGPAAAMAGRQRIETAMKPAIRVLLFMVLLPFQRVEGSGGRPRGISTGKRSYQ